MTELPLKACTAQRLMKIASDTRLTNPAHGPHLPPSWRTLYALTLLSDDQFRLAMEQGAIHSEMERADAQEFSAKRALPGRNKNRAESRASWPELRRAYPVLYVKACQTTCASQKSDW